jgi:3-phenylpropionate/cinnamic acid dioxygenase small subunit
MVYDSYTSRRAYSSSSSRPTISSYTATPYFDRHFFDDDFTPSYSTYRYSSAPIRVYPTFQRVGSYLSRPSFRFNYDTEYTEVPYHSFKRVIPIPMTRITTSPSRVYRERFSPVRIITPSARIYRRDINSPVRLVTSPGRIVNIRVRPSTLTKEFDRIDRKYRSSPVGVNDTEEYLNSAYALNFNDATREIRASTKRLMKEIHEPVPRAQSVSRYGRAASLQPSYSRFDPDLIDKYGNALIENEYHVSKNILRPTRKTRDQIEILSKIKYPDTPRRYTGISHLATTKVYGFLERPLYTRHSLARDFDISNYTSDKVRNDVNYLSYYSKNRDAVAADQAVGLNRAKKDKQNSSENKPLVIAKPIVFNDNKIQTVTESNIESDLEKITLNETAASG